MFDPEVWIMLGRGLLESLYMTLVSTALAYLLAFRWA
jgi:ABC-type methionine transport system permease subunit